MPTSARWEVANSPKIFVKSGMYCRADVGIGPYNHVWTYIRIRRRFTKVQLLSVVRSTEPRPCRLRLL